MHFITYNMSTSTRIMRSKGESDGLSLPMRTRPTRKYTILGRNGGTALNTTFNAGRDEKQRMPTQTPHLPTQSPKATSAERTETTAPMLPPEPPRPLTPCMPLPASPTSSSQSSDPLFKEDKYSSTSEEESFIHGRNQSNGTFANNLTERPTSTPTTSDYTTQGDQTYHLQLQIYLGQLLQMTNFWAQTIFSCQTAATDTYTRLIKKFFMQVTWKMATMHISWSYQP